MNALKFSQIKDGQAKSRRYALTPKVYESFLTAFADTNPLHVDGAYARKKGFKSKVMHGAILNGFLSHFIGVHFPGKHALLQSVSVKYRGPVYLGDVLTLRGRIEHRSAATKTVALDLEFTRGGASVATAKVMVGVLA